jgi:N-methylhydantoinase A
MLPGDTPYADLQARLAPLQEQAIAEITAEGVSLDQISLEPIIDTRYRGQSYELMVPFTPDLLREFHQIHQQTYGYQQPNRPVELVNLRLRAVGRLPSPALQPAAFVTTGAEVALSGRRPVVVVDGSESTPFYQGERLQPGHEIGGPAVIIHPDTTIFIGPEDQLRVDQYHNIVVSIATA